MTPRAWMAFVALGLIWGLPYFFIKIAVMEISPLCVAWSRIALGALVLLPIALRRGAFATVRGRLAPVAAFAVIEFAVPFAAISFGEQWISSSVTGILIAMVPMSIALLSRFAGMHEPLTMWRAIGLAVGFIGVVTLLGFGTVSGPLGWLGVACMMVATLCYATGPLIVQRYLHGVDSLGSVTASLIIASILLLPGALLTWPATMPSAHVLGSIAMLGIFCSAIAMVLMFFLIRTAGPQRASIITYINPMVATLLGVLVLHESLGASGYVAFALILLGSYLATLGRAAAH